MTGRFQADDLEAVIKEGSLVDLFTQLAGKPLAKPAATAVEDEPPCYHIRRPGAWPCGTAPSGPSPGPSCPECQTRKEN